jgi:hypothetical protein
MDLTYRWTKSVIRTYTPLEMASQIMEYERPAVDINEIHFHPFDHPYISAGCTDGITYIWDVRMPENILHELRHDKPIDELDHTRTREDQDTGVLSLHGIKTDWTCTLDLRMERSKYGIFSLARRSSCERCGTI